MKNTFFPLPPACPPPPPSLHALCLQNLNGDQEAAVLLFSLLFWLGSGPLLLVYGQGSFPLYLMKYTAFPSPDGLVLVLLSVLFFVLCLFFLMFLSWPGVLFTARDRFCAGAVGCAAHPG